MRIVCISDTHGRHKKLNVPDGDVLICAGDITPSGELPHALSFDRWVGKFNHKHKLLIAGNHDWCFQNQFRDATIKSLENLTYLEDSEYVADDIKFYGSPWQPRFCDWAFNLDRGEPLRQKWELIPDDVNVLITHCGPSMVLDMTANGDRTGCEDLWFRINNLRELKLNVFGHIHEDYGHKVINGVHYVNASNCTEMYALENDPIVVDL